MNKAFYDAVRPLFGGALFQSQVDGMEAIFAAWNRHGDRDMRKLAYILATAKHETASVMQPVRETLAKTDAGAKATLTRAWKAGKMPQVKRDYWSGGYFGRGFVQLTHKYNYERAGSKLGMNLVADPSLALRMDVSATILVRGMMEGWFTGRRLADYPTDFVASRRVVNGTDRAAMIAAHADKFLAALRAAPAEPAPAPDAPASRLSAMMGFLLAIVRVIFKRR
jgi:hypothetical protein